MAKSYISLIGATRKYISYGALALSLSLVSYACGRQGNGDSHGHEAASEKEAHHDEPSGAIHMEPEDAQRFGVQTETAEPSDFRDAVKTAAEILPSTSDLATASSSASGIVALAPGITQGATVKAGQLIARVKSSGMTGGDANVAAKTALENAKRELDRVTPLLADGLIIKKEYNDALAAYNTARAAYSPAAASGAVTAPRGGVITSMTAGEGAFVNAGDPVALISGSGRLTLRALLPVRDASVLPLLSGVTITSHGAEGEPVELEKFGGRLLSSSPSASSETPGYIPVYYTFDNSAPVVAGSAAEVFLLGSARKGVVSVPVSSIAEQLGEKFIFVKTGEHEYEKRPVKTGASNGTRVEITDGLKPGEKVVTEGVSFVRLAEQSTAVPEGHSHNH